MRSAFADAIEMFFADGGTVTRCPEGNALLGPEHKSKTLIGCARFNKDSHARACAKVLAAIECGAMTMPAILTTSGVSSGGARAAVTTLARERKIHIGQGPGKARLFMKVTVTGNPTGGPASDSADVAGGGPHDTVSARPGEIAA